MHESAGTNESDAKELRRSHAHRNCPGTLQEKINRDTCERDGGIEVIGGM
jgi:hypothetical protein